MPQANDQPPDRSHVPTEQRNPRTMHLHRLSVAECVELIIREDGQVLAAMRRAAGALAALLEDAEWRFNAGGRLIYVGAGTSGRLGVLDSAEAPPTFQVEPGRVVGIIAGGDAALRRSSESKEDDPNGAREELDRLGLNERDTLLGVATGGTTPYVLGAVQMAKQSGSVPLTGLLVCTPMVRPAFVDHLIVLETGAEVLTGSTRMKAGTATKLAVNIISTTLMIRSGRVYENLMVDLRATNEKLRDRSARIVATLTGLDRAACFDLLDRADNAVKTAVVMHRLGIGRLQAEGLLVESGGRLDAALASPPAAGQHRPETPE